MECASRNFSCLNTTAANHRSRREATEQNHKLRKIREKNKHPEMEYPHQLMFPSHYTSSQIAGSGKSQKQGQGILEARDLGRVRWREKERAKKKECGLEN